MRLAVFLSLITIGGFSTYYYFFFIRKKRPLVITPKPFTVIIGSIISLIGSTFLDASTTIGVVLILLIIVSLQDLWVVYGISQDTVKEALCRTCKITRTEFHTENNTFILKNSLKIKTLEISTNLIFYSFKNKEKSKHAKLTKKVFKKFILNSTI